MRFGAAQRAIGICNRLKAGKLGHAERFKFRLHFRATVRAMVQVDLVNVTARKPGWPLVFATGGSCDLPAQRCPRSLFCALRRKPSRRFLYFFPKTGEISYNNPFAATKAAADK